MKLLLVSAAFPPHRSGEATNAFFLAQNLASRGVDVHVLANRGCVQDAGPGVTVHALMDKWTWGERRRFIRFFEQCQPDAVLFMYIGWTYNHQFMPTFLPTMTKRIRPDMPFVTRFEWPYGADYRHTTLFERARRKAAATFDRRGDINYCYGTLLRDSDAVIVLTGRHERLLAEALPRVTEKTALIPPPPNMPVVAAGATSRHDGRRLLGLNDSDFVVSFLGFLMQSKGIDLLLRAFAHLRAKDPASQLVLMGGAIDPQSGFNPTHVDDLHRLSESLGLGDCVRWTGPYNWDTPDASLYLRASDVCVLPFRYGVELNNSSFASAVGHGLPIITTLREDEPSPLQHEENVFLCKRSCEHALAEALLRLRNDPALRETLATGAKRLANEWFSWDRAVERHLELLEPSRRRDSKLRRRELQNA